MSARDCTVFPVSSCAVRALAACASVLAAMTETGKRPLGPGWPLAAAAVAIVAILAGTAIAIFYSARNLPGETIAQSREALKDLARVAEAFHQGTITTRFTSYATQVSGSNYLQFAQLKQMEVFERKDSQSLFWGQLSLPDVLVEARAPVEYTYYLDLDKPWKLDLQGARLWVLAPPIEFNTPAVDASAIRFQVREGSLWRDEAPVTEALKASLTELCRKRAQGNVGLVRELGRRRTEEFVRRWLAGQFTDGYAYRVEVVFPDEPPRPRPLG